MKIYKYPLAHTEEQEIKMPEHSEVLSAGLDPSGQLCVWAAIDPHYLDKLYTFYVRGTGWSTPDHARFISTVVQDEFVWHIFVKP